MSKMRQTDKVQVNPIQSKKLVQSGLIREQNDTRNKFLAERRKIDHIRPEIFKGDKNIGLGWIGVE